MNMMQRHDKRDAVFIEQGTKMAAAIEDCILRHATKPIADLDILDFGAGVGRVALPFFFKHGKPSACVDVDPACIAYLQEQIPGANPIKTEYEPPLPFADAAFDVVYAASVWTHLPPDKADQWLREMARILHPGGLALLTTANYAALKEWRVILKDWGYANVTDDDLRREGMIFNRNPSPPGVDGLYGSVLCDPDWIRRTWPKYMPVVEIVSGGIMDIQDINVMRQPIA